MAFTEDALPWYKQFWPWFIFLLPASVVVAGITTVFIAINNQDSLVEDDYYKQGMGINRLLAEDDMAVFLGLDATITLESMIGEVRVQLSGNYEVQPDQLLLEWIHPTTNKKDFSMPLLKTPNGDYLGQLATSVNGRWYIQLSSFQPKSWRLKTEVIIPDGETEEDFLVHLVPGSGG